MLELLRDLPFVGILATASAQNIILTTIGVLCLVIFGAYVYFYPYAEWTLTYRNIPGPDPKTFLMGNLGEIAKAGPFERHRAWQAEYGDTFRYKIFGGQHRFFTADLKGLQYILSHPDAFPKPPRVRENMEKVLGNGLLISEGEHHRRQRKALNPSFSSAAIKDMYPIFWDKAYELRDKLNVLIEDDSAQTSPTPAKPEEFVAGAKKVDVMRYLGQCTIDVIGLAGFDYDFQALSQPKNELAEAYREMFSQAQNINLLTILAAFVPGFDKIPTKQQRTMNKSRATTLRIGRRLVEEKKRAVKAAYSDGLEKGSDIGKDLLSILVKANMASDLKPEQRISDEEMLAQITTFMLAGNETSATTLTWILYSLTQHPECHQRLQEELLAVDDERPTPEALNALPYLDAVIREALRVLPAAPGTVRRSINDSIIPLANPIRGRDGALIDSVKLNAGTDVFIPIMTVNHNKELWGEDAEEFNPDRFLNIDPEKGKDVPGVWGNLLTFLGGTRSCIGYRFALAEMKVILFVLMRGFEFSELKSKPKIEKKSSLVMRSRIVGEEKEGFQMPLMVKPLAA